MRALLLAVVVAAGAHGSALPRSGIAVETAHGVTLADLGGHVRRVLAGWQFRDYVVERYGQVELRDPAGRSYELRGGVLMRVPAGTITLAGGYSLRGDRAGSYDLDASGTLLSRVGSGPTHVRDLRTGRTTVLRHGCRAAGAVLQICGFPYAEKEQSSIVRNGRTLVGPLSTFGTWRSVRPSADGRILLAQWSGACEVPTAYLIDARTGHTRLLAGGREAQTLGWDGARALVFLPQGACGRGTRPPGVYAFDRDGRYRLVYRVAASFPQVRLWKAGNS